MADNRCSQTDTLKKALKLAADVKKSFCNIVTHSLFAHDHNATRKNSDSRR